MMQTMSMSSKLSKTLFVALLLALSQGVAWSAEPTIHDIYALADSGRVQEAQQLMQQVLRDHPNSARAHFVEAELLAKQNQLSSARAELATAERLAPGLPFASRESVQTLRSKLTGLRTGSDAQHSAASPAFPWGPVIVGGLLLIAIIMLIRSVMRRSANPPMNTMPNTSMTNNPSPYGPYGAPSQMPASGGMGSGLMGSLVTGAALGAGLVAGEAVAHKLMGDDEPHHRVPPADPAQDNSGDDNMGGNDFGISDSSSWGDSGGGDSGGGWD